MLTEIDNVIDALATRLKAVGINIKSADSSAMLIELEIMLSRRLPASLQSLLSRYAFESFDIGAISLFAWNKSPEKNEYFLAAREMKDTLSELLLPSGYFQIGRPDTGIWDAVCIDFNDRAQNRESRIVLIDHEEILCNSRIRISAKLWPSFRALLEHTAHC